MCTRAVFANCSGTKRQGGRGERHRTARSVAYSIVRRASSGVVYRRLALFCDGRLVKETAHRVGA